jgi:hypothetical protein
MDALAPCQSDLELALAANVGVFKPLVAAGLPQSPSNKGDEGLGFVREGFRIANPLSTELLRWTPTR